MIVAINKPLGVTSHDVVNMVRKIAKERRVGHAGTLDPLAEGVLVIGIGRASTKQLGELMLGRKTYAAKITLGATSTTDDEEGEKQIIRTADPEISSDVIKQTVKSFVGDIQQMPPAFSAIKMGGTPAYKLARQGKNVILGKRSVTIDDIRIVSYLWPKLIIEVDCQKGVYIRSLARDIGEKLNTGGYLSGLVRTRVGEYTIDKALAIEDLEKLFVEKARES